MTTCPCCNRNQTINTSTNSLAGMAHINDVMKNNAAIVMNFFDKVTYRAKRCDDERHFIFCYHRKLIFENLI